MNDTVTKFYMRYALGDKQGYYYTRWDTSTEAEIIADSKKEAIERLENILGDPSYGKYWAIIIDKIVQEPIENQNKIKKEN